MTDYMVYYRRNPTFRADKKLKYRDVTEQRTHVLVSIEPGYIDNPHKDEKDSVFYHMQGDFMRDHTRILCKNLIISGEMGHTSMSVGDVLRDADTGEMWQCDDVGWVEVRGAGEPQTRGRAPPRSKRGKLFDKGYIEIDRQKCGYDVFTEETARELAKTIRWEGFPAQAVYVDPFGEGGVWTVMYKEKARK